MTPDAVTLRAPAGARLRLGVLSDTHGRPHAAALSLLAAERPDAILHAGDIGDADCLTPFAALAPLVVVRGNIDERTPEHPESRTVLLEFADGPALSLLLLHIGVHGARLRAEVRREAERAAVDLVVCGHSHLPLVARDGRFGVFNPGSCGPKRFGLPITVGVIDVAATGVSFRHLDCTTGALWRPQ